MHALRDAMPRAVADLIRSAPLSPGKVEFAWRVAVGASLHRNTKVRLDAGVLFIDAASRQWGAEIRRSSAVILDRLQRLLGETAVRRLEVRTP